MSILNDLKGVVSNEAEEKIEDMAAGIANKLPENVVDGAEDMINNATGMDLDLNKNEIPAEGAEPTAAVE